MKRILILAAVLIVCLTNHPQETKGKSNMDEATLVAINRQSIRNFLNNDTVEHSKIIHPIFFS